MHGLHLVAASWGSHRGGLSIHPFLATPSLISIFDILCHGHSLRPSVSSETHWAMDPEHRSVGSQRMGGCSAWQMDDDPWPHCKQRRWERCVMIDLTRWLLHRVIRPMSDVLWSTLATFTSGCSCGGSAACSWLWCHWSWLWWWLWWWCWWWDGTHGGVNWGPRWGQG